VRACTWGLDLEQLDDEADRVPRRIRLDLPEQIVRPGRGTSTTTSWPTTSSLTATRHSAEHEFDDLSERVNNSIKYVSPDLFGFTIRALIAAGEGSTGRTAEVAHRASRRPAPMTSACGWAPSPLMAIDTDYVARDQLDASNDSHFWRVQAAWYLSKRTSFIANVVALKNKGHGQRALLRHRRARA
jgi:predicted porin